MSKQEIIVREYNGVKIHQRDDGYMNATAMCKANGKEWADYQRLDKTEEFILEACSVLGIPRTELIVVRRGGSPSQQGTWVHPLIAYNLAQWCSAKFAVQVSIWLHMLNTTGRVDLRPQEQSADLTAVAAALNQVVAQLAAMQDRLARLEQVQPALESQLPARWQAPPQSLGCGIVFGVRERIREYIPDATESQKKLLVARIQRQAARQRVNCYAETENGPLVMDEVNGPWVYAIIRRAEREWNVPHQPTLFDPREAKAN